MLVGRGGTVADGAGDRMGMGVPLPNSNCLQRRTRAEQLAKRQEAAKKRRGEGAGDYLGVVGSSRGPRQQERHGCGGAEEVEQGATSADVSLLHHFLPLVARSHSESETAEHTMSPDAGSVDCGVWTVGANDQCGLRLPWVYLLKIGPVW